MKRKKTMILTILLTMALVFSQMATVMAEGTEVDEVIGSSEALLSNEESNQEDVDDNLITSDNETDPLAPLAEIPKTDEQIDDEEAPAEDMATPPVDNQTAIADGTYKPDSFTAAGGTGKVKITCSKITIREGKAYATIVFASPYYTQLKADGKVYQGKISQSKGTSAYEIPISLNTENTVIGTTTAMSEAHDITYTLLATLSSNSQQIADSDDGNDDNDSEEPSDGDKEEGHPAVKLADGTYKVKADTDDRMFYIYTNSKNQKLAYLKKKGDKMTVTITLTGQGYDYLYLGTTKEAAKAGKSKWTKFKNISGYYTYTFSISKLDTKLQIASHSKNRNKWYQHTIIFYSKGAVKVKSNASYVPSDKDKDKKTQKKPKNDHKKDRVSKSTADSGKSTSAVNNGTNLKDGVYTPDKFSWSGGTGRLAYIDCSKITVTGGKAYATIVFGSSGYDLVKASGRTYARSGGGLSTFVIPVKLNANNTIVGRTVAMSQPHWITYSIYVYSSAAASAGDGGTVGKEDTVKKSALSEEAPEIVGLTYKSTTKVKYAKYFKIYQYNDGIKLLQMDITEHSGLSYKSSDQSSSSEKIQYDDEGKAIAKSQNEITEALYHNKVVNYLLVPKGAEIPAGLDKDFIIVRLPADKSFVAAPEALAFMDQLKQTDSISALGIPQNKVKISSIAKAMEKEQIKYAGSYKKTDYKILVKEKVNLAILPGSLIPEKRKDSDKKALLQSKQQKELLEKLEKRYTTLEIPLIIDRCGDEKGKLAKAEWIKVYGALFGCQKEAKAIFDQYVKDCKK